MKNIDWNASIRCERKMVGMDSKGQYKHKGLVKQKN